MGAKSSYEDYIHKSRYARYVHEESRRETSYQMAPIKHYINQFSTMKLCLRCVPL
jgi:hypothetical protein